ncbi:MAG: hypothetical protein ACPL2N_06165 [Candidatus Cryosericum sp.]
MELYKERGPIYSRYDDDHSDNYQVVVDYAAPPRSREEREFITAHNIRSYDLRPGSGRAGAAPKAGTSTLSTYMQAMMAQRAADQSAANRSMAKQDISWAGSRGHEPRTEAQKRMATIGVIIWAIFILLAMLMGIFGR